MDTKTEKVPQQMMCLTLYSDGTLTVDGRARSDCIPFILRTIADALDDGHADLVDVPLN